jgi:methionine biosynthesis protein MetW
MARLDYQLIEALVPDGATVLDLGCGDGELLDELVRERHVRGSGVDIDERAIEACIRKGLSVFHGDLDEGLADYEDGSTDVVILSFSLQQLRRPRMVVREMARVGRLAVVSFPNFAHWAVRGQLLLTGRMPVSTELPYQWYDTPNIHLCTVKDFRDLCAREGLRIERESYLRSFDRLAPGLRQPNLTARIAIFAFTRLPSVTEVAPPQV